MSEIRCKNIDTSVTVTLLFFFTYVAHTNAGYQEKRLSGLGVREGKGLKQKNGL